MNRKRILAGLSAIALATGITTAVFAAPAFAASAPSCMHTSAFSHGVYVTNRCGRYVRAKAIFSYGRDSQCDGYNAGDQRRITSGAISKFDALVTC